MLHALQKVVVRPGSHDFAYPASISPPLLCDGSYRLLYFPCSLATRHTRHPRPALSHRFRLHNCLPLRCSPSAMHLALAAVAEPPGVRQAAASSPAPAAANASLYVAVGASLGALAVLMFLVYIVRRWIAKRKIRRADLEAAAWAARACDRVKRPAHARPFAGNTDSAKQYLSSDSSGIDTVSDDPFGPPTPASAGWGGFSMPLFSARVHATPTKGYLLSRVSSSAT
jgi:hypothetical protein